MHSNYTRYDKYHLWGFVKEQKENGLIIKHYGFSFHIDPVLLEEVLAAHPDVDLVQLQLKYADWENPGTVGKSELVSVSIRNALSVECHMELLNLNNAGHIYLHSIEDK